MTLRFRPKLRETLQRNNAADRHYAAMYGKAPMAQAVIAPPRQRHAPDPSAPPLEREVLKAVWKYLAHHPKVAWVTRMNSGSVQDGEHYVRFHSKRGMSDLIGQMRDGRFLACEVKRDGESLMEHQREFLNEVLAAKGVAFVARSLEDAIEALSA